MNSLEEEKLEYILRAKASMDVYLRSKTWKEKIESIERMNVADEIAKKAMRKTLVAGTDAFGSNKVNQQK